MLEIDTNHFGTVIKDRTGKFQDAIIEKPGEDFGRQLAEWLKEGAEPAKVFTEDEVKTLILKKIMKANTETKWKNAQKWLQDQEWFNKHRVFAVELFTTTFNTWKESWKDGNTEEETEETNEADS